MPGGFGVTIFFFLSGFLITSLMRMEFEKNGRVNIRHFWVRRILRILPPFYLVLLSATFLSWLLLPPRTLAVGTIAAQALHVTNYWVIFHGYEGMPLGTGIFWSLAVEEHFYFLFPWLYVGMQKVNLAPRSQALLLWGICAAVLLWRCFLVLQLHPITDRTYMGSDARVDSILFGCALAVWRNPVLDPPVLGEKWWKFVLLPAAFLVLGVCLAVRSEVFRETLRYSLQGAALTLIFVAAMRFKDWAIFRPLNLRPVAFIGVLSYSIYLVHFTIILSLQTLFPGLGAVARGMLALVLSIATAWAIYTLVERPCARLRKRLTD